MNSQDDGKNKGNASGHRSVLQTKNLTKRYGDVTAVRDLSLEVREGEVFGMLGPNGAGKTTSINMMCGLLRPDQGTVLIHGQLVAGGDPALRARVGVCPQSVIVWPKLTCREQLQLMGQLYGLPAADSRRRSEMLLVELDLVEKQDRLAYTLSGGMQRRLNLALALVHDPEILVLDEPEAGLDPQSRVRVREYIQSLARRKTIILTTHNMDEADRLADRVAIIDHGELLVLDTPEALKQRLGQGDVIEIALPAAMPGAEGSFRDDLASLAERCRVALSTTSTSESEARTGAAEIAVDLSGHLLQVRAMNAVARLPVVLDALNSAGLQAGEISIRANTLEDVFIQLTGRRLRD